MCTYMIHTMIYTILMNVFRFFYEEILAIDTLEQTHPPTGVTTRRMSPVIDYIVVSWIRVFFRIALTFTLFSNVPI